MNWIKKITIAISFLICSASQANDPLIDSAKTLYDQGNYSEAIASYNSVVAKGLSSSELHYNLGNAYYRNGNLGKAILHFEKALKLSPGDEDALFNLQLAESKRKDEFAGIPDVGVGNFLASVNNGVHFDFWAILSTIFIIGAGALFFMSKKNKNIKLSKISIASLGLGIVLALLSIKQKSSVLTSRNGIITSSNCNIFSEPNESSTLLMEVHEGSKMKILEENNGWLRIQTPSNEKGWISEGNLEEI